MVLHPRPRSLAKGLVAAYLNHDGAERNSHIRSALVKQALPRKHEQYNTSTPLRDVALFVDSRAMREVLLGALRTLPQYAPLGVFGLACR